MKPDLDRVSAALAAIDANMAERSALLARGGVERSNAGAAHHTINVLVADHMATHRFGGGTYNLRVAGLAATCTAGGVGLLNAWTRKARKLLTEAGR